MTLPDPTWGALPAAAQRPPSAWPLTAGAMVPAPGPWRLTIVGILRSELRKLTTMTSTWVLLGLSLALGLYTTASVSGVMSSVLGPILDTMYVPWDGITLVSQTMISAPVYPGALMALLGIIAITNEYDSGMIRTTLTVAPARWPALTAKVVVVAAFAFLSTLVGEFLGALIAKARLGSSARFDLFTGPGLHVWCGSALVVMLLALMGLAFGVLLRTTAWAVLTFLLGVMLVLPFLVIVVSSGSANAPWAFWHVPAAAAVFVYAGPFIHSLGGTPPVGTLGAIGTMLAWTLVPLAGAYLSFLRRDA